jgi:methylated-DNA-[protein]-cysteine S-methyltransferase
VAKEFRCDRLATPLGEMLLVVDREGQLCGAEWIDHQARLERLLKRRWGAVSLREEADPAGLTSALRSYFAGNLSVIDTLPVNTGGTDFQREVWRALRKIPCGSTLSYGALAAQLGRPTAVRAVGHANGTNAIGVVVPCHRVVGSTGALTGYGSGLPRKQWLLAHERG